MRSLACIFLCCALFGCTQGPTKPREDIFPVSGAIRYQNMPLADATVTFTPKGDTRGFTGTARTDANGAYTLTDMHGNKGMVPGEYSVTISRRIQPDGSVVPADDMTPPIESMAKESLPPRYSSPERTELSVTVTKEARTYDFDLK